jgi:DNA-binding NtrC family response regulator
VLLKVRFPERRASCLNLRIGHPGWLEWDYRFGAKGDDQKSSFSWTKDTKMAKQSRVVVVYESSEALRVVYPLLRRQSNLHIIAGDIQECKALDWVANLCLDLVLVEWEAFGTRADQFTVQLSTRFPALPVIVFSMRDDTEPDLANLNCPAYGFVGAQRMSQELPQLVEKALQSSVPTGRRNWKAAAPARHWLLSLISR